MKSINTHIKLLVACMALIGIVTFLKASYYQPDFFPIGLTGINPTNQDYENCPYGGILDGRFNPLWKWENNNPYPNQTERKLIFDLGVNCIGSQDGKPSYYVSLNPTNPDTNNYLNKACVPSHNDPDWDDIYIITSGYYVAYPKVFICCSDTIKKTDRFTDSIYIDSFPCDTFNYGQVDTGASYGDRVAYNLFRTYYRPAVSGGLAGYGSMLFTPNNAYCSSCISTDVFRDSGAIWNCHGTRVNNWNTFEGDSLWRHQIADKAVQNWATRFSQGGGHSGDIHYIWGYNLISEEPAIYRNTRLARPWEGCWAAVNRVFRGGNLTYRNIFSIPSKADDAHITVDVASHKGIRGIEEDSSAFNEGHRMIVAKGCIWPLAMAGVNIFEYLPDIDIFLQFPHGWLKAYWNYGEQVMFDSLLYGRTYENSSIDARNGEHYTAIYMQKYGKTNLAYPDQRRRWIAVMALEWQIDPSNITRAKARRPCPPEIRCATYLQLSRGAKGVLFQPWTYNYRELDSLNIILNPKNIQIPVSDPKITRSDCYNLGLRDQAGYPFGMSGSSYDTTHKLNDSTWTSGNHTYWHDHNRDTTYYYLAHSLIPEIKLLAPTLMQLDWVNGYSLNSTDPEWASPCPHAYVMDVSGVSYMDLALFDHPYEPVGVEYFMLVNREGIADMTNRDVTVALDAGHWPDADSLTLTDIANKEHPRTLKRQGDRYVFTQVFEPGEGKLYRVAPVNEPPITMLHH